MHRVLHSLDRDQRVVVRREDAQQRRRVTRAPLICPVCSGSVELLLTGSTTTEAAHLCVKCGSTLTTPLMRLADFGAFDADAQTNSDPAVRSLRIAFAVRYRAERASLLSQQAERLLTESERLISESHQILRDNEQ
jgi:hypothetical protein